MRFKDKLSPLYSAAVMLLLNIFCIKYLDVNQYSSYLFYLNLINVLSGIALFRIFDFRVGKYGSYFTTEDLLQISSVFLMLVTLMLGFFIFALSLPAYIAGCVLANTIFLMACQYTIFGGNLRTLTFLRLSRGLILTILVSLLFLFEALRQIETIFLGLMVSSFMGLRYLKNPLKHFHKLSIFKDAQFRNKFIHRNLSYIVDMSHVPIVVWVLTSANAPNEMLIKTFGLLLSVVGILNQISSELLRAKVFDIQSSIRLFFVIISCLFFVTLLTFIFVYNSVSYLPLLVLFWLCVPYSGYRILEFNREKWDVLINLIILIILLFCVRYMESDFIFIFTLSLKYVFLFCIGFWRTS